MPDTGLACYTRYLAALEAKVTHKTLIGKNECQNWLSPLGAVYLAALAQRHDRNAGIDAYFPALSRLECGQRFIRHKQYCF